MKPIWKVVIGGLAAVGAGSLLALYTAKRSSIAVYSPLFPDTDLIKLRGDTLLKLMLEGGGTSKPKKSKKSLLPISVRVKVFDDDKPSAAEVGYDKFFSGTNLNGTDILPKRWLK